MKMIRRILLLSLSLGFIAGPLSSSSPRPLDSSPSGNASVEDSTAVTGRATTLLPDGRWLLTGGYRQDGSLAPIAIRDPLTQTLQKFGTELNQARAWHTATVLPDGTILILGGMGPDGRVVPLAELLDPESQTVESVVSPGLTPRAHHTATLLTDGRVLIAGGVSDHGAMPDTVELWDPRTGIAVRLTDTLRTPRQDHTATLLPDGRVSLWGGKDEFGQEPGYGEVYDPKSQACSVEASPEGPSEAGATFLEESAPKDGAVGVPVDTLVALRFSRPVPAELLNAESVSVQSPQGKVAARVVPAEGGMLVFITPRSTLLPGTTYTVSLSDPRGGVDLRLPAQTFSFETAGELPDEEDWTPGAQALGGDWNTHRPASPWQSLPPLQAAPGVTAVAGQALTLDGKPLAQVTIQIEDKKAVTDHTGRFLLIVEEMAGHCEMLIDGRTASRPNRTYGIFEAGLYVIGGRTNILPYTIWMPRIDTVHAVTIPSPTTAEVSVTTPLIPGLELHIPPHALIRDHEGKIATQISITPIPVDRPPFPLPTGIYVPIYFTIQPGGGYVKLSNVSGQQGAWLIYPNYRHEIPGTRANFWHYDPEDRGWYVYGHGTVTPDGRQVVPDSGVMIYEFTGAMINTGDTPPPTGPAQGNQTSDGDPVDLNTGLFVLRKTDLSLPDLLPVILTRTYRQGDTASRSFGIGSTHPYAMFLWSANQYQETDLILPDGGRIHYPRISPGVDFDDAVFEHTATPTAFYKSRITWNGNGWDLRLKDGTVYVFGDTAPLQSIRDRYGNTIKITWSSINEFGSGIGTITRITSCTGRWIEFTYDASNRITQARDNIGRSVSYVYDTSGRLWTVTDAKGGVTTYTYDTSHRLWTITDARSVLYLTNEYESEGRVIRQTQADDSAYQFAYTLDANGKVTQTDITDPRGNLRRVTFNSMGYTLTDTRAVGTPLQQMLTFERQAGTNLILSVIDGLGRRTAYDHDSMGNLTSITYLAGTTDAVTSSFTYEPTFNQVASITDPLEHTVAFAYDGMGNLTDVTDPLQHHTTLAYNSAGQPTSVTDPMQQTIQFTYDSGDLVAVTDPLGRRTTRFLDGAGRLVSVADPLGQVTRFEYDSLNLVTKTTDPMGNPTNLTYDPNGNLLRVTDARGNATNYAYDDMDRMMTRTDPLLRSDSFEYDASGNLTSVTDRRGKVTFIAYDALGRKTFSGFDRTLDYEFHPPGINYESRIYYTYDLANRPTRIDDSLSGTIANVYDGLNRLISQTTPQGAVGYTYDLADRRMKMTVQGQADVSYTYDDADRLRGVTQGASSVTLSYDSADRRSTLELPSVVTVTYNFNQASQLTGLTYRQGGSILGNLTYAYDQAGKRVQVGGSFARTGLPLALTSATYDVANQLTAWGPSILSYDPNGNLLSDGTNAYTWDGRNQLTSVTGAVTASFEYDPLGRRISRTVNGAGRGYLLDGVNPVQEFSGGITSATLLTGLATDEYFTRTDSTGTRTFLADTLGSTIALTDPAGVVQTQYTYEAFGRATSSGVISSNALQYTGRENDGTGLYYYRARYYSPALHRFLAEDPIEFGGGDVNLYAYSLDSPTNVSDPSGEVVPILALAVIGAAVGGAGSSLYYSINTPLPCVSLGGYASAVGKGAAAGAIGSTLGALAATHLTTAAGLGLVGSNAIAGIVNGAGSQGALDLFNGSYSGWQGYALSAVSNAVAGGAAARIPGLRLGGARPGRDALTPVPQIDFVPWRYGRYFGKNSGRVLRQETFGDVVSGGASQFLSQGGGMQCKKN